MKTAYLILTACWLLVLPAHPAIVKNLEFKAEDGLPSAQPDIELFNSTGFFENEIFAVNGTNLEQRTFSVDGYASYHYPNNRMTNGMFSAALDLVMETRLRVWNMGGRKGAFFEGFDGTNAYSAQFTHGGVVVAAQETGFSPVIPVMDNLFHTYRLESRGAAGVVRFFMDGVLCFHGLAPVNTNSNGFGWGDGAAIPGAGADVDWDYLRVWQRTPLTPCVTDVQAHCGADTVTIRFNKAVALDGNYSLDGATVLSRRYGASAAEVVLATSPLVPRAAYTLTVRDVHDLDGGENRLEPNPTLWEIGCASGCGELTGRPGPNGAVVIEWNDAADTLQTSTNLVRWWDAPGLRPPVAVPRGEGAQFFRLRCDNRASTNGPVPAFIRDPDSFSVEPGRVVTFRAEAVGAGPIRYQWFQNGTNLPGATGTSLTVVARTNAQEGVYELRATNVFGHALSGPGYLLLIPQPPPGSLNTTMASPSVTVLHSRPPPPGLPRNTTVTPPSATVLLFEGSSRGSQPFNTVVAAPPVTTLLLREESRGAQPFNTSLAVPPVSLLLFGTNNHDGLLLNATTARPPVRHRPAL